VLCLLPCVAAVPPGCHFEGHRDVSGYAGGGRGVCEGRMPVLRTRGEELNKSARRGRDVWWENGAAMCAFKSSYSSADASERARDSSGRLFTSEADLVSRRSLFGCSFLPLPLFRRSHGLPIRIDLLISQPKPYQMRETQRI